MKKRSNQNYGEDEAQQVADELVKPPKLSTLFYALIFKAPNDWSIQARYYANLNSLKKMGKAQETIFYGQTKNLEVSLRPCNYSTIVSD